MEFEQIPAGAEGHDHFFEGSIASSFPDSVDGAFHLSGAILDRCEGICYGQAKIIMTVDTQCYLFNPPDPVPESLEEVSELRRDCIAYGVRNVDCCCSCLDGCFANRYKKFYVGSGGIHR